MTRQDVELHLAKFGMWNRKGNLRAAAVELEAAMRSLLDFVDPAGAKPVTVDPATLPVISGTLHLDLTKLAAENVEVPVKKRAARSSKKKVAPKRRSRTKKAA
jgi:hypothetical protein